MSLLPPVGWADVATKRDLDTLSSQLRGELRAEFHRDLGALIRTLTISLITAVVAVASLAFGAARLI